MRPQKFLNDLNGCCEWRNRIGRWGRKNSLRFEVNTMSKQQQQ